MKIPISLSAEGIAGTDPYQDQEELVAFEL